ncbi:unnamed protein product [Staurois parvus]|uniref:Uncharacterized protein n=1 Tax=Staurois parvus TaxID=386267 RepID=A0ABN9HJ69_9NEOB|nr:unnamed protein product [Staurois parvus]
MIKGIEFQTVGLYIATLFYIQLSAGHLFNEHGRTDN